MGKQSFGNELPKKEFGKEYALGELVKVGATGLEHPAEDSGKTRIPAHSGAESGAVGAQNAASGQDSAGVEADLRAVIEVWPALPETVKAGILAMVRTCRC